ncbi:hypothetical protein DS745_03230 [Anaerobacillus alkaliphilus]|uniref:Uncharacterized protein n=1 Tax=Anaerobacillus alkaliphilus TaxID=1548597 RepID=A0A4Q0VYC4_9BACI|nr:hypothetical protein [Anaerobacillus alkaliphilus]RXJ04412.1 hypothetical protein DS745_03230 [Anaerobacillus alkaliphilus]
MKKVLVTFLLVFLVGCNSELAFTEVKTSSVSKNVQEFIELVSLDNGVHLHFDGKKAMYVFLNGRNVVQGNKATYFSNFHVDHTEDTIHILFDQSETRNFSDPTLTYELLYKIQLDKEYETIKAIANGEEIPFTMLSGN